MITIFTRLPHDFFRSGCALCFDPLPFKIANPLLILYLIPLRTIRIKPHPQFALYVLEFNVLICLVDQLINHLAFIRPIRNPFLLFHLFDRDGADFFIRVLPGSPLLG